tara:strand:+ start:308 stop:496 length:189 start_codon:yes stop_codon:yes gene_type:complete
MYQVSKHLCICCSRKDHNQKGHSDHVDAKEEVIVAADEEKELHFHAMRKGVSEKVVDHKLKD